MNLSLALIIIVLYGLTTACLWLGQRQSATGQQADFSKTLLSKAVLNKWFSMPAAMVGVVLHLWLAAQTSYVMHSFNFSVASMTLWVSALVVLIYLIGSGLHPIRILGLVTLPVAIGNITFALLWGDNITLIEHKTPIFFWHIGLSIAGFTVLALSVLQSILFAVQEYGLKNKTWHSVSKLLPPVQTMERVLFQLINLGFTLLSIAIILGAVYNYQTLGNLFSLTHHNLLAVLSWCVFAVLLYGRRIKGWRGIQTVKWTVCAFVLLKLGYFGSKLVTEFLQH